MYDVENEINKRLNRLFEKLFSCRKACEAPPVATALRARNDGEIPTCSVMFESIIVLLCFGCYARLTISVQKLECGDVVYDTR